MPAEYASSLIARIIDTNVSRTDELIERYYQVKEVNTAEAWDVFISWLQAQL